MLMSRDLMLRLASLGFRIGLFVVALTATFALVLGSPNIIKGALHDSKVYGASKAIAQNQLGAADITPAIKPAITETAAAAFSPPIVRSAAEQFVDGTYHWLDGTAKAPDFSVDLTPAVQQFMNAAGNTAADRAKRLPTCTVSDRPQAKATTTDILFLNCLPPGNTPAMIRGETIARLRETQPILKNPIITADSLVGSGQSQPLFDSLSGLPAVYQTLVFLPWLLSLITFGLAGVVVIIFQDRLKTAYALARGALWAGLAVLAVAVVAHVIFLFMARQGGPVANSFVGTFQPYIIDFMRSLEGNLAKVMLTFGGVYAIAGGLAVVIMHRATRPPEPASVEAAGNNRPPTVAETVAPPVALPHVAPAAPIGSTIQPNSEATESSNKKTGADTVAG